MIRSDGRDFKREVSSGDLKKTIMKQGTTVISTLEYVYDEAGRLETIKNGGSAFASYAYDGAGRLTAANAIIGTGATLYGTASYADSQLAGSLGSLGYKINTGSPFASFGYAYYADGALAEAADTVGSTSRSYEWDYNADGSLELSPNGQPLVQYVWGLLGPIARVDLQNGSNTRYYVLDARGHARALVDSTGSVTDYYEAWGNVLPGSFGSTPFKWNAAGGYQHIPFTGLYHVGAREYDPRTARWLQRDPIGQSSGDPNLYRYCGNDAVNLNDPSGLEGIVVFVHGSRSSSSAFSREFLAAAKQTFRADGHVMYDWSGSTNYNTIEHEAVAFAQFVAYVKKKHPTKPVYVVAHSNGGNLSTAACSYGAPVDLVVRLGSPTPHVVWPMFTLLAPRSTKVLNFYDPDDYVAEFWAQFAGGYSPSHMGHFGSWSTYRVDVGDPMWFSHSEFLGSPVWRAQIHPLVVKWAK